MSDELPKDITYLSQQTLTELRSVMNGKDEMSLNILKNIILGGAPAKKVREQMQRENHAYYKIEYAKQILPLIESLAKDKRNKLLPIERYPQYTLDTLKALVNQAKLYILDKMDPDGIYAETMKGYRIEKLRKGLLFRYLYGLKCEEKLELVDYVEGTTFEEVKKAIEEFIEEAPAGTKRVMPDKDIDKFDLTDEEVFILISICEPAKQFGLVFNITNEQILVGKAGV